MRARKAGVPVTDLNLQTAAPSVSEERHSGLRDDLSHFALTDVVPCAVWTARPDGWVDYANQFWIRFTGLTLEQTYGWGWLGALHPDDLLRATEVWQRALQVGEQVDVEYRIRRGADGAHRWFLARGVPVRDAKGSIVKWFGTLTDIDEQKRLEEERALLLVREQVARLQLELALRDRDETLQALAAKEEQYRVLAEVMPQCIWTAGPDGQTDYVNQHWCEFSGLDPVASLGSGWAAVLHPDDAPACHAAWTRAVQTGEIFEAEYRMRRTDGMYRWFLGRGLPVRDRDGRVTKWLGTATDIDDRIRAVADLEKAKGAAEAANRAKSEFLSRMSHELRTPLNAILGFGQLLEMGAPTPGQRQHVEQILKGGRHLLELINEVLDLARIEAGWVNLALEPLAIRQVCAEACDLVRPLAQRHGIRIDAPCAGAAGAPDVYARADNQRLKQVLLNLLANGVKYNRANGSVSLTWEELPEGRLRLAVRDTGRGIDPAMLQRLFNPFDRLGAETTAVEGTGLGLALSKRLTEAMGGKLHLTSTVGQGTTVTVDLPRAAPPERAAGRAPATLTPTNAGLQRGTVVYIEDNRANLALMQEILAYRPAVRLLPAMQGGAGLELARQHRPDVILLDAHLPDMPGEEVLRQVRSDPHLHATPVVIISADATMPQIERFRAAGAEEYLTKPIDVSRLLALLDRFTQERHRPPCPS
jgi:PAS domain S-box-containing protein